MAVTLSQLAIQATVDASGYVDGMADIKSSSDKTSQSVDNLGAVIDTTNTKLSSSTTQLERWSRTLDPAYASQQKLAQGEAVLQRALDAGSISAERHAELMEALTARYTAAPQSAGLMATAAGQITNAVNDNSRALGLNRIGMLELQAAGINSFQSLAAGMSPLRVATMETAQVLGAFAQGGAGLSSMLSSIVSPAGLAVAAVATIGTGIAILATHALDAAANVRQFNVSVSAMGTGDAATAAGLQQSIRDLEALGVAAEDAQKAITSIATNAALNPASAGTIATVGANLGAVLGVGTVEGVEKLTSALTGSVDTIIKLGESINAISPAEDAFIRQLARDQGASVATQQAFTDIANLVAGKLHENQSLAQQDAAKTTAAWNTMLDSIGNQKPFQNAITSLGQLFTAPGSLTAAASGQAAEAGAMPFAANGNSATLSTSGLNNAASYIATQLQTQLGLDSATIAGFLANLQAESGLIPGNAPNGSTGPLGLAQWTGPRRQALEGTGGAGSLQGETAFMISELQGPYAGALQQIQSAAGSGGSTAAADAVLQFYEGINQSNASTASGGRYTYDQISAQRQASAQQYGNVLSGVGTADQTGAIGKQTDAINEQAAAMAQLSTIYGKTGAEAQASQAAMDKFNAVIAAGGTDDQAMTAAEQKRAEVMAQANAETNKALGLGDLQVSVTNQIATAYTQGGDAIVRATVFGQAQIATAQKYGPLLSHQNELTTEYNLLLSQAEATERQRNAQDIQAQQDTQAVLQLEIGLQGQSTDQINAQVALLQAKQTIEEKFPLLSQAEKDQRLAVVAATIQDNYQLAQVQRTWQQIDGTLTSVGNTIDQDITNNLEAAFDGQKITSWGTLLHQILAQAEAQLVSLAVIKPALGSPLGAIGFGAFGTAGQEEIR